jgi:GNAT superfamily N-acetyltransferase
VPGPGEPSGSIRRASGATIRRASVADATALARLRWDHCLELDEFGADGGARIEPAAFAEAFQRFIADALASGHWAVWIAESDGAAVGTASLQLVPMVPSPWRVSRSFGYVTSVQVDPPWRARGLGRELMDAVRAFAREHDAELLLLWPGGESLGFYLRLGFARGEGAVEQALSDRPAQR